MKFINLKEFTQQVAELPQVVKYLSQDLSATLRSLKVGLAKLTFAENFESFEVTVTIAAGATSVIRNQFRDGTIPSKRLITRISGTSAILDGTWDRDFVRLQNAGATSATLTVTFLK
jgi:hypothetical protein